MSVDQAVDEVVQVSGTGHEPSPYQVVGDELCSLTDTLLAGEAVLDRAVTEELLRVLGAVVSLHRLHDVDRRGRCSICRTGPRRRWFSRPRHDVCTVHAALSLHLGCSVASQAVNQ